MYVQPRVLDADESHDVIDFESISAGLKQKHGDNKFAGALTEAFAVWFTDE